MSKARVISTCLAVVTVGSCAAVAIGMAASAADRQHRQDERRAVAERAPGAPTSRSSIPAQLPGATSSAAAATTAAAHRSATPATSTTTARAASSPPSSLVSSTAPPTHPPARTTTSAVPRVSTAPRAASSTPAPARHAAPVHKAAPKRGGRLPLRLSTGSATRVITVVASSSSRTTAWLQPWYKAPGGGWLRWGKRITAHIGSDGMSWSPSESRSATPIGSFTLTRAFGHNGDPGTPLPYVHTNPSYWWISQSGRLYNTMQHCWSHCPFRQGSPNEHLYYETPYYNYAVVIDYNTRNAGRVRQGAGSAFFMHVTDGAPTAGCVAIPQWRLVQIMRWLSPSAHPRILIGVA